MTTATTAPAGRLPAPPSAAAGLPPSAVCSCKLPVVHDAGRRPPSAAARLHPVVRRPPSAAARLHPVVRRCRPPPGICRCRPRRAAQGSQNRWEPVQFGWFLVEPVRPGTQTGPVPTSKPCLIFLTLDEPAGLTGLPTGFFEPWEPASPRFC
jgi:hypothetical protein